MGAKRKLTDEQEGEVCRLYMEEAHLKSPQLSKMFDVSISVIKRCLKKNEIEVKRIEVEKGDKFGRWTVIEEVERRGYIRYFLCECSCINKTRREVLIYLLVNGDSKSCGCYQRERVVQTSTLKTADYKIKHPLFYEIEEIKDREDGIEVKCKHCKNWFKPSNSQTRDRIRAIENTGRLSLGTELNFYCSEECKHNCDTYRTQITPKSLRNVKTASRCNQRINRQALLDLQIDEYGYNYCEKCGKEFGKSDIALHHNIMVSKDHDMADDMSHQLLLCKKCHKHKGC